MKANVAEFANSVYRNARTVAPRTGGRRLIGAAIAGAILATSLLGGFARASAYPLEGAGTEPVSMELLSPAAGHASLPIVDPMPLRPGLRGEMEAERQADLAYRAAAYLPPQVPDSQPPTAEQIKAAEQIKERTAGRPAVQRVYSGPTAREKYFAMKAREIEY